MRIVWDAGTNTMEVYFDGVLRLTVVDDFVTNVFQTSNVFWGSTGSTGGAANQHYVCPPATLIALPIELVRYSSLCNSGNVELIWATVSELNNDYFTIERSIDGVSFEEVGVVMGAGNSDNLIKYSWVDKSPLPTVNYYRLKQTDFDGEFSYSTLKAATCTQDVGFGIYPNPAEERLILSSALEVELKYQIVSMDGRMVMQGHFIGGERIDVSGLTSGAYFVKATSNDEVFQEKLIKK